MDTSIQSFQSFTPRNLLDVFYQILRLRPLFALLPLASISDASDLIIQPDCTAQGHLFSLGTLEALPQQVSSMITMITVCTSSDAVKIQAMCGGTATQQGLTGNFLVIIGEAIDKSKRCLWTGVLLDRAELDDVALAFVFTMLASEVVPISAVCVR